MLSTYIPLVLGKQECKNKSRIETHQYVRQVSQQYPLNVTQVRNSDPSMTAAHIQLSTIAAPTECCISVTSSVTVVNGTCNHRLWRIRIYRRCKVISSTFSPLVFVRTDEGGATAVA